MKRFSIACTTLAVATLTSPRVMGYDIPNHYDLSTEALGKSVLATNPQALLNLGLSDLKQKFLSSPGLNSSEFTNGCKRGVQLTIINLVGCGGQFEDIPKSRSLNHFFEPIANRPLTIGTVRLGMTSPDWSLEDNNEESSQAYSYKDARNYFFDALTTPGLPPARDAAWGKLFQSIGQVVHHVQDMAQPQHVRNDQHMDIPIPSIYQPSGYETYTRESRAATVAPLMSLPSAAAVYTPENPNLFKVPRDFWSNAHSSGLADFTNFNFVSAGTNFEMFGGQQINTTGFFSPSPGASETVLAKNLLPALSQQILTQCAAERVDCTMSFYGTTAGRQRAATLSIFDQHIQLRPARMIRGAFTYNIDRVFTLNRFNHDVAHQTLIPRAVSYSAGLINYFFRGKMEISLPDEGVYGAIDHTVEKKLDIDGFRKIRLKLKNTTPRGADIEPMSTNGKLRAVVKYHRNGCYAPDLSGEYGAAGKDWLTCRSDLEFSVVSREIAAPTGLSGMAQPVSFEFDPPIPINATDLFLQVVYRGPLGDEPDAVAVVTKDISEPTYQYKYDTHDQFMYARYPALSINGGGQIYTWTQWCGQAISDGIMQTQAECNARLWPAQRAYQFSATNDYVPGWDPSSAAVPMGEWTNAQLPTFNPLFTLDSPVGSYSRVAYLTDAVATNKALLVDDWNGTMHLFSWVTGVLPSAKNQMDPSTKTLTPTQKWAPARGIYVNPSDAQLIGSPSNVGALKPQSAIRGSNNPF
ncbi:MAG: hypothetical protein V4787_11205 [Pseudomonadota bacterium]